MNILTLTPRADLKLLVVEVPEDTSGQWRPNGYYTFANINYVRDDYSWIVWIKPAGTTETQLLPRGKWSSIGLLKDIDTNTAYELVDKQIEPTGKGEKTYWRNYQFASPVYTFLFPEESLHSLIRASGGKETQNVLILKQE